MSVETINLTESVYRYYKEISLREPQVLKKLREETLQTNASQMQISPEQGQFMRLLIEILGAKKTLDIGTFTGYSALSVAMALPSDGKVFACEINPEWISIANHYWQLAAIKEKIILNLGPALETLDRLIAQGESNTFDFIFIDADKKNYINYYEKSLTLLRPGGIIAIDNVLWNGRVAEPSVNDSNTNAIRTLNQIILADERVNISMLPIGDGLTLVRKN